jgi:hypothetical protein
MINIFGRMIERHTVEALVDAMIDALNSADRDADSEVEPDDDDERYLPKLKS